jgi:hypothetical protein
MTEYAVATVDAHDRILAVDPTHDLKTAEKLVASRKLMVGNRPVVKVAEYVNGEWTVLS